MFCPKCGTGNPEDGKFCRKCGTDLAGVSEALYGGSPDYTSSKKKKKESKPTWEAAIGSLSMGVAFIVVAFVLGVTGAVGGQNWWYWMLIPGFSMLGSGVAKILRINSINDERKRRENSVQPQFNRPEQRTALSQGQNDYVSPSRADKNYDTGDLVPASVVENTTKLLELDADGNPVQSAKKD